MINPTHPRERLIRTASTLVHRQGWTLTGINQILTEAGIPKGSFYYYFRSKEALGVAVLERHHENLAQLMQRTLLDAEQPPMASVSAFFLELSNGPLAEIYRFGCPAGNMACESATQCPPLLNEAQRSVELYRQSWEKLVRRAKTDGLVCRGTDPAELASTIVMLLQGAFLATRSAGTFEPLEKAHTAVSQLLFDDSQQSMLATRYSAQMTAAPHALAS